VEGGVAVLNRLSPADGGGIHVGSNEFCFLSGVQGGQREKDASWPATPLADNGGVRGDPFLHHFLHLQGHGFTSVNVIFSLTASDDIESESGRGELEFWLGSLKGAVGGFEFVAILGKDIVIDKGFQPDFAEGQFNAPLQGERLGRRGS